MQKKRLRDKIRNDKIEKTATYQVTVNKNVIAKDEMNWLKPSTWGREEIIKVTMIIVLIILIIIAIILKVKISREKKNDEDFDLPGGDELDKALAEHQELENTEDFEETRIFKNVDYKDDDLDNTDFKRKGKHF